MKSETVLILGASDKADRYSYKALKMLLSHGHKVVLIHPTLLEIEGHKVFKNLSEIKEKIDTVTMYINPSLSSPLQQDIMKINPKRVIFNPGTENKSLEKELKQAGINTEEACTLVLLSTEQF